MSKQLKNLLSALTKATQIEPDKIPVGWFSIKDMMKESGRSYDVVKRKTRAAEEKGLVESKFFMVRNNHNTQKMKFYKVKKS